MKVEVNFITPTKISLIDITSMGDSSKRGNENTIGQFDSGLKYAIAILLRHGVSLSIHTQGEPVIHENWEEPTEEIYYFSSFNHICDRTGKEKELIQVDCEIVPHGGHAMNPFDMREPSSPESWTVQTGFAKALGYNWELWMALRELYSNMLDEKGHIGSFSPEDGIEGTVMTLSFQHDSEFNEVWENRHLYINDTEPLFKISERVEILENKEGYLRIYKQNILVHKDEAVPSRFAYNIKFGDIDERRILNDVYSVTSNIMDAIRYTTNLSYLSEIISPNFQLKENEYLSNTSMYGIATDTMHDFAASVFEASGSINSYPFIMKAIRERKDCKIDGKQIRSIGDSIYSYSNTVKIESKPVVIETKEEQQQNTVQENSVSARIKSKYNLTLNAEIREAKLKGSKVIADKHEKCLIIDPSFDIESDMPEFIVQYLDLTRPGNIVKNLSEFICEILKK